MLGSDWFPFPGLVTGSDWSQGGGVRLGDFQAGGHLIGHPLLKGCVLISDSYYLGKPQIPEVRSFWSEV